MIFFISMNTNSKIKNKVGGGGRGGREGGWAGGR